MIPGWDKALRTMKVGERSLVRVLDSTQWGYGSIGIPSSSSSLTPLVPPDATIEFDLEIIDSTPPMTNIDFDNLALADNTPVRSVFIFYFFRFCYCCLLLCDRILVFLIFIAIFSSH